MHVILRADLIQTAHVAHKMQRWRIILPKRALFERLGEPINLLIYLFRGEKIILLCHVVLSLLRPLIKAPQRVQCTREQNAHRAFAFADSGRDLGAAQVISKA